METRVGVCGGGITGAGEPARCIGTPSPVPCTTSVTTSTTTTTGINNNAISSGRVSQSPIVVLPSPPATSHQSNVPRILSRNVNGTRESV